MEVPEREGYKLAVLARLQLLHGARSRSVLWVPLTKESIVLGLIIGRGWLQASISFGKHCENVVGPRSVDSRGHPIAPDVIPHGGLKCCKSATFDDSLAVEGGTIEVD